MTVQHITPAEALERTGASLGLAQGPGDLRALVATALRRAAGIVAPCRSWELVRAVWTSLKPLADGTGLSESLVEDVLDELLMIGDLAEVTFGKDENHIEERLLLCLTPFAFVRRQQGYITLLGGRADESTTLPNELAARIVHKGAAREIAPLPNEHLPKEFAEFGLIEIEADAWLRLPRKESATAHIQALRGRMPAASNPREIEGIKVIGPGTFYPGRWSEPTAELAGLFVARRPQAYGAPIWSAVLLHGGRITSLLDLHAPGSRWRSCDIAWQLQAALDCIAGAPQSFRKPANTSGSTIVELFAPLPSWAERRLRLSGERIARPGCLMAFALPAHLASAECQFLQDYLWMRERAAGEGAT